MDAVLKDYTEGTERMLQNNQNNIYQDKQMINSNYTVQSERNENSLKQYAKTILVENFQRYTESRTEVKQPTDYSLRHKPS